MDNVSGSKFRGTVIKVPDATPGIVFTNGEQRPFTLEGVWKSATAPAPNMTVDVELTAAGAVASVTAVDAQQLSHERMSQLGGAAQEQGKQAAAFAMKGVGALADRMGKVTLGATVLLWIAFFFLPAASVSMFIASKSYTFWDLLGFDMSSPTGGTSHGLFALLGLIAIAAPFVVPYIKDPRAKYGNAFPLAYIILYYIKFKWDISQAVGNAQKAGGMFGDVAAQAVQGMSDAISFGFGMYVLVLAAIVLAAQAFVGARLAPPAR